MSWLGLHLNNLLLGTEGMTGPGLVTPVELQTMTNHLPSDRTPFKRVGMSINLSQLKTYSRLV
jgi:hypothetical protein